jgi:hypothetical protein
MQKIAKKKRALRMALSGKRLDFRNERVDLINSLLP